MIQLFSALAVNAQDWVAGEEAVATVERFFTAQRVWVFSPEVEHPVYVALSAPDQLRGSVLAVKAAREGGDEIFRCWNPHHGFADSADGKGTSLQICYHCRRAALVNKGRIIWFTIALGTESDMNTLFRKYQLPGSKPETNQAPEPTSETVTSRAGARLAPSQFVAHL